MRRRIIIELEVEGRTCAGRQTTLTLPGGPYLVGQRIPALVAPACPARSVLFVP